MPEDLEVGVTLVPDEEALEDIEERQLEISGEPGAVDEAKEQNQEQTEQLSVIGRSLGRVLSVLKQLSVIAALVAVISKILGAALDIGFEDVRDAIVTVLNQLKNSLLDALPFGGGPGTSGQGSASNQVASNALGGVLGGATPLGGGILGQFLANAGNRAANQGSQTLEDMNINLFTSREMLTGDSTQQEMESQNFEDFIINGGS